VWLSTDTGSALPEIQVPAVLIVRDTWPAELIEERTWTAQQIPGASVVTLPGEGEDPYLGNVAQVADAVERFVSSIREEQEVFDRVLATVLFTDIVGSTEQASRLGDREWKQLM
jgi:class 3 adenylate cyclase